MNSMRTKLMTREGMELEITVDEDVDANTVMNNVDRNEQVKCCYCLDLRKKRKRGRMRKLLVNTRRFTFNISRKTFDVWTRFCSSDVKRCFR